MAARLQWRHDGRGGGVLPARESPLRATSLFLVSLLVTLPGCAASGDLFAGNGQGRTLGEPPDDDDAAANDDDAVGDDDDDVVGDDDDSVPAGVLAAGIDIVKVTFNQGVQTTLMENDSAPNDLPLITGRAGLLLSLIHI